MIKYAVKYLKNTFHPLKANNDGDIKEDLNGKLVLVRTEKGEEVLKAFVYFTDGKDQIDTEQLRYILTTFGTPMTEAEVKEILEISEVEGKPGVSTSQFVEFWAEQ
jgi:Ca2+-binding EF-hand superfamily protein